MYEHVPEYFDKTSTILRAFAALATILPEKPPDVN
jgi:hypothetical protein